MTDETKWPQAVYRSGDTELTITIVTPQHGRSVTIRGKIGAYTLKDCYSLDPQKYPFVYELLIGRHPVQHPERRHREAVHAAWQWFIENHDLEEFRLRADVAYLRQLEAQIEFHRSQNQERLTAATAALNTHVAERKSE